MADIDRALVDIGQSERQQQASPESSPCFAGGRWLAPSFDMGRRGDNLTLGREEVGSSAKHRVSFQLLEFSGELDRASEKRRATAARRVEERVLHQTPRERFLRAIEMERRGFMDGALANLRGLYREVEVVTDPCLAISIRYFLASFLTLKGQRSEARSLARDGIILAWEHEAREEMELFDQLFRRLADGPADGPADGLPS